MTCQESRTFSSASTSSLPISLSTPFHTLCLSKEHHYSYDGSSLNPLYLASPSHRRLLFCPPKGVISFSPPDHGSPTHPSHHPLPPRCLVTDGSISTDNPLQSVLHTAAEWVWKGRPHDDSVMMPGLFYLGALERGLRGGCLATSSSKDTQTSPWISAQMSPDPGDLSTSPEVGSSITFYTSSFVTAFLATLKISIMPSEVS